MPAGESTPCVFDTGPLSRLATAVVDHVLVKSVARLVIRIVSLFV